MGFQVVKPLKIFDPSLSGGRMKKLKQKKPSQLNYSEHKFNANLFFSVLKQSFMKIEIEKSIRIFRFL